MQTPGQIVNDVVLRAGILTLVDFTGTRLRFFPRGRLPPYVAAYLDIENGYRARALRDYLVNVGRGLA